MESDSDFFLRIKAEMNFSKKIWVYIAGRNDAVSLGPSMRPKRRRFGGPIRPDPYGRQDPRVFF